MTMIKGIQIEVIDDDPDYLKLRISATNGEFAGVADVYVSPEGALELATKLDSFPRSPLDTREVLLGSFGRAQAGGAAKVRLFCSDSCGTSWVEVQIESGVEVAGSVQTTLVVVPVEATGIDKFLLELRALNSRTLTGALLPAVARAHSESVFKRKDG